MAWPNRLDYFLAVQNPGLAFSDPELRSAKPNLTPLGTPWSNNGAFASVYQFECNSRKWAVKCFLNEYKDQNLRYQAISSCLNSANLPYAVGFEYQAQGILVAGKWYPILKMEWIKGETLDGFIKNNLHNPTALSGLADKWLTMMATLRQNSVAHGDLQHGNVFVVDGELKLIDYDGMFVPALQGSESREIGHRNYQHPTRTQLDFGPHIDNFSAWVIYISLRGLAANPAIWNRIKDAGDDRILFSKEDFDSPAFSQVIRDLSQSNVADLDQLVQAFKAFVSSTNLQAIPPLVEFDAPAPVPPIGSDWIKGFQKNTITPNAPVKQIDTPSPGGDWLESHLPHPTPRPLSIPPLHETVITYLVIAGCLMLMGTGFVVPETLLVSLLVSGFAVATYASVLVNRFKTAPELAERTKLRADLGSADGRIEQYQARLGEIAQLRHAVTTKEQSEFQKLQDSNRGITLFEQQALSQLEEESTRNRTTISKQQSLVGLDEKRELALYQSRIDSYKKKKVEELKLAEQKHVAEIHQIANRRKCLPTEESGAIERALRDLQNAVLREKLSKYRVDRYCLSLDGIGPVTVDRLLSNRIITAADIPDNTHAFPYLLGINATRRKTLVDWRHDLKARVLEEVPKSLPPYDEQRIRDTFKTTLLTLDQKLDGMNNIHASLLAEINNRFETVIREEQRLLDEVAKTFALKKIAISKRLPEFERTVAAQESEIYQRFQNERRSLEIEAKKLEARFIPQRQTLDNESSSLQSALTDVQWERRKIDRDLIPFAGITFPAYLKGLVFRI